MTRIREPIVAQCFDCAVALVFYSNHAKNKDGKYRCVECRNKIHNNRNTEKRHKNPEAYRLKVKDTLKHNHLMKKFNLTLEDFNDLIQEQDQKCLICGGVFDLAETQKIAVDHNHQTGKVRGILCQGCNTGLGMFKDDVGLILKAAEYLIRTNK